jgi:multidrug efflux pump subunit AcrB
VLAEFCVRRWQFTLVAFAALLSLGVYALVAIPKAEDPAFPVPNFKVVAFLPGASPRDLERLVIDPLEASLAALDDVKSMKSEARDGLATVFTEFRANIDPERKRDEVLREVNAVRPRLPPQLARLEVLMYNAAHVQVLELGLQGAEGSYRELEHHSHLLRRRLESVPGVGEVSLSGLPKREVTVTLDPTRLATSGITGVEIYRTVSEDATAIPAGSVEIGPRRFSIATSGDYRSLDELRATVIRTRAGRPVRLDEVATVALADAEASNIARFDGKRAVIVGVAAKEGVNVFDVTKSVEAELRAFEPSLPPSLHLQRGFDQSKNVAHRLSGLSRDFILAVLLVLFTLLPLGLRASFIVMVSIPLSLSIGVLMLKLTGFTVNQMSITGFVIALGLLVDDSVVVVENITRHMREGRGRFEAAISATKEISASVLGCTATLVLAFVPLLALPGASGQFIRSMPVAIVSTVLASLLVSLTIIPFLASLLLRPSEEHGNALLRGLVWLVEASYRPVLRVAVRHPALTLGLTALLLAASVSLVPRVGFSLFPKAETPHFLVRIEASEGASLPETDRAARFVEAVFARHPEISHVATVVGKGHPQVYYNVPPIWERASTAEIFAQAGPEESERTKLFDRLRQEFAAFPGAKIELHEFANGPFVEAPVAVRLISANDAALQRASIEVERVLKATQGTRDVRNPARDARTDLRVVVDRTSAGILGVKVPSIDQAVRLAVSGVPAGTYRVDTADEAYAIRLTLPRTAAASMGGARPGLEVLDHLYVASETGSMVPLSQMAHLAFEPSAATLRHHNRERCVTVTAHVKRGFNVDRVTRQVLAALAPLDLRGVRVVPAGEFESRQESFGGLGMALMVAAFGILAVLVLEFRTFRGTIIVASVIPLGVIGGILALYWSGNTFSFIAIIGFVALMGIEVKNSILLVDFTNQLREQGLDVEEAVRRAGETRFVPVLLTTLTALGGLLPLALEGSSLYSPLAFVILGGLISSTLLARVVTPVLYKLLAPEVELRGAPALAAPVQAQQLAE